MRLYLILITLIIINILLPYNIIASDSEYYIKILEYGTDSDITGAFKGVQEDKGIDVNQKVVAIFNELHSDKVYLSLIRYLSFINHDAAEGILKNELEKRKPERKYKGDDYYEEVIYAFGEIGEKRSIGSSSIELLKNLYMGKDTSKRIRMAILDAWGRMGNLEVEDDLLAILQDDYEDTDVKARAIIALGEIESTRSIEPLKDILLNSYEKKILRMYAAYALSRVGRESVLDTLEEVIYDSSHEVAEYAVKGISDMESDKCGPILIKALRSDYDKVRYYAVVGLSKMHYPDALNILEFKAEYDVNDRVRMEAKKAVELLQGEDKESSSKE